MSAMSEATKAINQASYNSKTLASRLIVDVGSGDSRMRLILLQARKDLRRCDLPVVQSMRPFRGCSNHHWHTEAEMVHGTATRSQPIATAAFHVALHLSKRW